MDSHNVSESHYSCERSVTIQYTRKPPAQLQQQKQHHTQPSEANTTRSSSLKPKVKVIFVYNSSSNSTQSSSLPPQLSTEAFPLTPSLRTRAHQNDNNNSIHRMMTPISNNESIIQTDANSNINADSLSLQHNRSITSEGGEDKNLPFPGVPAMAFNHISQHNPIRYWLLKIITSSYFEKISMFVIIVNCITMGMFEPCAGHDCHTPKCRWMEYIDHMIYFFFAIEMCMKIFALGLKGKNSYLGESWNRLDCFIVLVGATDYINLSENSGITAIRTIRVLRPLRAINRIPSMRILVTLIIDTLPMLGNVALLSILIFTCFGIVGVQLWQGLLRNRCFSPALNTSILDSLDMNNSNVSSYDIPQLFYEPEDGSDFVCSLTQNGMQQCSDVPFKYNASNFIECRTSSQNPYNNAINFDNIGYAFIVVFQVVTLESWTPIMFLVQDAHTSWTWVYFVAVIIIGSFFLLNMVLVIISVQFGETRKRETELMLQERRQFASTSTIKTVTSADRVGQWESLLQLIGSLISKLLTKIKAVCCKTDQSQQNTKKGRKKGSSKHRHSPGKAKTARDTTTLKLLCCCCFKQISQTRLFIFIFDSRDRLHKFVIGNIFPQIIFLAILVNSFLMAIEHHEQAEWLTNVMEYGNYFFTVVFILEMLFKLVAFGIYGYIKDPMNLFDGFIVFISIFEIFADAQASGISVLRTFRLLRIFKAFRFIPTIKRQIVVMVKTLDNVATFGCLLMLFIFIFSTLGMHLFGCKFYEIEDGERVPHRKNFDSLFWATITVFQILTQSDWNEVLYTGMDKSGPWSAIYFILLMIFGNYVLFSLLVAILVEGFSEVDEADETSTRILSVNHHYHEILNELQNVPDTEPLTMATIKALPTPTNQAANASKANNLSSLLENRGDYSFYLFSLDSKFRQFFMRMVTRKWFKKFIFYVIGLSCVSMAMERPNIEEDSWERGALTVANYLFTFIFTVEMLVKVIAQGLCVGPNTYLKDNWNRIDFFLVVVSLINLFVTLVYSSQDAKILSLLKILRLLRTFRPLRAINNAPGLKLVVTSLISSLKPIGNTVLICLAFFIIFAILGVQLLSGKLYECIGDDLSNVTTKNDCISQGYEWRNSFENYDNVLQALFTLFIIATKDGWVDYMYKGIDAVGVDMQPVKNHNEYMAAFYIFYLLVVGFFVVNMFVGVIVDNFHKCRRDQQAEENRCKAERKALARIRLLRAKNVPPYWINYPPLKLKIHNIISSAYFDLIITIIICVNILTMVIEYYMMPKWLEFTLEICNYVFTAIFLIEGLFRIYILGVGRYFKDRWNQLDMFIIVVSLLAIIIGLLPIEKLAIDPTLIRVIRTIRITRILKILKTAKGLQALLKTVAESLPQVGNLALLFCILFFIFSTLGVELFGKLTCDTRLYECPGINTHTNFNNFWAAFLTLFRVTTGDAWSSIMIDSLKNNAACVQSTTNTTYYVDVNEILTDDGYCLNSIMAPIFFISFVLIAQFVLMNVVIAVLMKQLEEANKELEEERDEEEQNNKSEEKKKNVLRLLSDTLF